jgi:hypothetical protein
MRDLDLLVPPTAAGEAHRLLQAVGYAPAPSPAPVEHHHLPALRRPDRFGSIELHVEPVARGWAAAVTAADVWGDALEISRASGLVQVPAAAHEAAIDLVHSYLADQAWFARTVPLRTVHELWLLDQREAIDWSRTRACLSRVNRSGLVDEHLVSAHVLLGAPRPTPGLGTTRSHLRLAASAALMRWPAVERYSSPVNRVLAGLDRHRLEGVYGCDAGGAWRLRAHHFRRQVDRFKSRR